MTRYHIEVETGDLYQAGTDHKIKIEIVGTNGKTRLRTLDSALTNEFERNQKDIFVKEDNKMTLLCPKSRFIISTQTMPKKSFLMDIILYYLYLYLLVHLYICIDAYLDLEPNMAESRQNWRNLSRLAQL